MGIFQSTPTATGRDDRELDAERLDAHRSRGRAAAQRARGAEQGARGRGPPLDTQVDFSGRTPITCVTVGLGCASISRTNGDWRADGFAVGQTITISNAKRAENNGTFTITEITAKKIFVNGDADVLASETSNVGTTPGQRATSRGTRARRRSSRRSRSC